MAEEKAKKNGSNQRKEEQEVDTGYSWIILAGSFFVYLFVVGSLKCFGVLYTEMLDVFRAGSGNTAWIGSIALFTLQGLAPLANVLTRRFSFRLVSFVGGIMVGCGYFLSGFVNKMELMYLTFTIAGFGYGLSFTSSSIIISLYFKKRRTLANGIMISSGSIAVLLFPFLYRFIIDNYGLSRAFWIIGAMFSNICVASCVFRQPKNLQNCQDISLSDNHTHSGELGEDKLNKTCCGTKMLCLLKNGRFILLVIAVTLCTIGQVNNSILIPAHIKALGYNNTYVSIGVSITGVSELIARVLIGWFADLNIIKKINIFVICTFVGGIIALISPLFDSFTFIAVYVGVEGAFPASTLALLSVLLIERVGIDNFQPAFAFISVCKALACMISLPISDSQLYVVFEIGWLADYYGNWFPSFVFTGITLICAGVTALLESIYIRFGMNKGKTNSLEDKITNSLEDVHIELVPQARSVQGNGYDTKVNVL